MKVKILLSLALLSWSGSAWSQDCAAGIPSAGNPGCIPPDRENSPYYNGASAPPRTPRVIWADRWGAIAMDFTNSGVGTSSNAASKHKAEKAALTQCRSQGGDGCQIALVYYDQCGVIAWGESYSTTARAATIEEASEMAMRSCGEHTNDCQIYYSDCSMAERIQ